MATIPFALVALFVGLVVLLLRLQRRCFVLQYLFFLRFPLLTAATIALLPVVASFPPLNALLGNLFVVEPLAAFVLTTVVAIATLALLYMGHFLFVWIPFRFGLCFSRSDNAARRPNSIPVERRRWIDCALFAVVALPCSTVLVVRAPSSSLRNLAAVAGGLFAAVALRWLATKLFPELDTTTSHRGASSSRLGRARANVANAYVKALHAPFAVVPKKLGARVGDAVGHGFQPLEEAAHEAERQHASHAKGHAAAAEERESRRHAGRSKAHASDFAPIDASRLSPMERALFTHERAATWFLCFVALYGLGFLLTHPAEHPRVLESMPAFAFVVVLATLLCIVLAFFGYFLDLFRVPPLFALAAIAFTASAVMRADYLFPVRERPAAARHVTATDALDAWVKRHPDPKANPAAFVVAASGGGITAACWTTTVLRELTVDPTLAAARFPESIVAMSTVSGGSVGAMYYVDSFGPDAAPTERDFDTILPASGHSSLPFTAWGLAYPDFWRFTFGVSWSKEDRGSCQEHGWARLLRSPKATLVDWRDGVLAGWRPVLMMNATVVETGERMQLMPLDTLTDDPGVAARAISFLARFPKSDVDVVTAARLSATFPYVTPVSRPQIDDTGADARHHCADGGYTDNYGVLSALEFLRAVVASRPQVFEEKGARRLALVEIRASDPDVTAASSALADQAPGWAYELAGPVSTMLNVRTTAQSRRNDFETDLLRELAQLRHCQLDRFVFVLPCESPLSWQLTADESRAIQQGMIPHPDAPPRELAIQKRNEAELARLRDFVTKPD